MKINIQTSLRMELNSEEVKVMSVIVNRFKKDLVAETMPPKFEEFIKEFEFHSQGFIQEFRKIGSSED